MIMIIIIIIITITITITITIIIIAVHLGYCLGQFKVHRSFQISVECNYHYVKERIVFLAFILADHHQIKQNMNEVTQKIKPQILHFLDREIILPLLNPSTYHLCHYLREMKHHKTIHLLSLLTMLKDRN